MNFSQALATKGILCVRSIAGCTPLGGLPLSLATKGIECPILIVTETFETYGMLGCPPCGFLVNPINS